MSTKKYILAAATLFGLTTCQQEEMFTSTYDTDPNAVKINTSIVGVADVQTRVNTDGDGSAWSLNDMIKVTNASLSATTGKHEATYTYTNTNGWALNGDKYLVWADGENTFNAFYPYEIGNLKNSFTDFVLPIDQSDVAKISHADWMLATTQKAKSDSDKTVNLEFSHQLVKMTIKIVNYNNEFTSAIPEANEVSDPRFTLSKNRTPIEGKNVTVQNSDSIITGLKINGVDGKHSFTAILLPGLKDPLDDLFQFKVRNITYKVRIPEKTRLEMLAGHSYTYHLTVGKNVVTIGSVTVKEWGASDWNGVGNGGTADEEQPL